MATGGDLGVLEVLIEVMNAGPYLLLRMTRRVNAFKTSLTWLVRKYLITILWLQAFLTRALLKIVRERLISQSRLGGCCSLDDEEGVSFF